MVVPSVRKAEVRGGTTSKLTRPTFQIEVITSVFAIGAVLETGWTILLAVELPRHYVAIHWDLAWVGLDTAQVVFLLLSAWAAWRRRAILIQFANTCATLLIVDAWFDVTTARYSDVRQSVLSLIVELPSAAFLFWISFNTARRLASTPLASTTVPSIAIRRGRVHQLANFRGKISSPTRASRHRGDQ